MPVVKLRQDAIRGLAYLGRHEKHQCIYWDKALPGFGLRVYASCRRAEIPTPERGYWARVESGQQVVRAPLPPAPESLPELLRVRGTEPPPASKMSEAA